MADEIRKPLRPWLIVAVVVAVLATGLFLWFSRNPNEPTDQSTTSPSLVKQGSNESLDGEQLSSDTAGALDEDKVSGDGSSKPGEVKDAAGSIPLVAVFGVERLGEAARPDAVAVIGIENQTSDPVVVSLRPDESLGDVGSIASVYAEFGPETVTRLIGQLLSLPLTQYVVLDYQVFESMIDRLGGVEIEVKQSIGVRSADGSRVTIQPGRQCLSGKQVLAYIRYKWAGDERSRLARQAEFLQSLRSRLSEPSTIRLIPTLIRDTFALIETNISLSSAISLVDSLRWSEMNRYRLVVITSEVSGDEGLTSYRTSTDFVSSGIDFKGVEHDQ